MPIMIDKIFITRFGAPIKYDLVVVYTFVNSETDIVVFMLINKCYEIKTPY